MLFEIFKGLCTAFLQKIIVATCGGLFFALFGGNTLAYEVVFILTMIDLIVGLVARFHKKTLNPNRDNLQPMVKMLLYFLVIVAAHQVTRYVGEFIGLEYVLVSYIAINELLSITKHLDQLGLPMPNWALERIQGEVVRKLSHKTE